MLQKEWTSGSVSSTCEAQPHPQPWCGPVCSWAVCYCRSDRQIGGCGCVSGTEHSERNDRLSLHLSLSQHISSSEAQEAMTGLTPVSQMGRRGQQHTQLHMLWSHRITHTRSRFLPTLHGDSADVTREGQNKVLVRGGIVEKWKMLMPGILNITFTMEKNLIRGMIS